MAEVQPVQTSFVGGMKRDFARNAMPTSSMWNAVDVIANQGAPLRERGGWAHQSEDLATVNAGTSRVEGGIYATFVISGALAARNLAVDEDGRLYNCTSAGSSTSIGTAVTVAQNPVFHGGTIRDGQTALTGLVIIPDGTGAAVPKVYDGTTMSDMTGTPPKAKYATVYKDYTVLANGTVGSTLYPNRIWFSPEGDPDCVAASAWDTTDSWIDFGLPIKGIANNRNAILVFGETQVARVRGSIPPPDEDMVVDDPVFKVGLYDAMSLAEHKDSIIWAAPEGVFRSDAVTLDDITKRGGMLTYWTNLTKDATSSWTFAGGVHRDTYFLSVMDGSTFKDCFAIDLQTMSWTRLSNVDALSFWNGQNSAGDELYFGRYAARVARLSTIYVVGNSTYKNDGDGDAVASVVETAFFPFGRPGQKRIRRAYTGYELTDYLSDNPTVAVTYITTPEETSYTTGSTFSENSTYDRKLTEVNKRAWGVGLKYTRSGAGDFLLYDIGVDGWQMEMSRRAA